MARVEELEPSGPRGRSSSSSREVWAVPLLLAAAVSAAGCQGAPSAAPADRAASAAAPPAPLPAPRASASMPLDEAIRRRRSVRAFRPEAPSAEQIGALVWAAQGITEPGGEGRAAPSAGALYPLEVLVATREGVSRYLPAQGALARVVAEDRRPAIARAALDQQAVREAPLLLVLVGRVGRTRGKYGDGAERFVAMEAGHAAQNVLLTATALGLGAVPVGALDERAARAALDLGEEATPLYVLPIGLPRE